MDDAVVVTGFGMVSSLGSDVTQILARMDAGEYACETREVRGREVPAAMVREFEATDYIAEKKVRRMDNVNCYAIAAATRALDDAGIVEADKPGCGVIVGTGFAGFASVVEHQGAYLRDGMRMLTPFHFPNTVFNATAGMVAIELGLNGPNSTVVGYDVSGEYALTYAWMLLRQGMAERIVVIGADDLCPALLEGLHDLGVPRRSEAAGTAPFSRRAEGLMPSEGSGALVLERAESAARRGARVLGRVDSIGMWSSADSLFGYGSAQKAIAASSKQALVRASVGMDAVSWVSSSANGQRELDAAEAQAWSQSLAGSQRVVSFKRFLGDYASSGVSRIGLALHCATRGKVPGFAVEDALPEIASWLPGAAESLVGNRVLHQGVGIGGSAVSVVLSV
ncbi:MAG: hypothetical protein JWL63_1105 [Rhodocyclales bacterium]|nr:hypothetical protein [Rhodocyclales bacterium]